MVRGTNNFAGFFQTYTIWIIFLIISILATALLIWVVYKIIKSAIKNAINESYVGQYYKNKS